MAEIFVPHIGKLWIITLMHGLKLGVILAHLNSKWRSEMALKLMESQTLLIQEFNETFGLVLAVNLFSMLLTCISILFQFFMWAFRGDPGAVFFNTATLVVNALVIFAFCRTASEMDTEV